MWRQDACVDRTTNLRSLARGRSITRVKPSGHLTKEDHRLTPSDIIPPYWEMDVSVALSSDSDNRSRWHRFCSAQPAPLSALSRLSHGPSKNVRPVASKGLYVLYIRFRSPLPKPDCPPVVAAAYCLLDLLRIVTRIVALCFCTQGV